LLVLTRLPLTSTVRRFVFALEDHTVIGSFNFQARLPEFGCQECALAPSQSSL